MNRLALTVMLSALVAACGAPKTTMELGAGPYILSAQLDGGGFSLTSDAGVLLNFPSDAVQLGTMPAPLDDALSYDPYWLEQKDQFFSPVTPPGLRWRTPTSATLQRDGETLRFLLQYEAGVSAVLTLTPSAAGRFSAVLEPNAPDGLAVAFVRLRPRIDTTEGLYGLGEWFDGANHRGKRRPMQLEADLNLESLNVENHVVVPLLIGTRGWGLFVESRRPGLFDVAHKADDLVEVTYGTAFDAQPFTFHLFAAARPLDITRHYYDVTGAPVLPPPWALGPWVWRNENRDQQQVLDDLAQLRALDLATSGYWIDRPYATWVNSFDFALAQFPDPQAMFSAAADAGLAMALWHTPYVEPSSEPLHSEAVARGYFPPLAHLFRWSEPLDFTAPGATAWWQGLLGRYTSLGVQGFKLDYAEDVVTGLSGARIAWRFADGSDERTMHSRYALLYHQAYAGVLGPSATFLLCRAGRWGDQVNAPIIWPGDIDATLTRSGEPVPSGTTTTSGVGGLPAAVSGALSLGPSGFPFFAADTGGYRHSPPDKETWVRWVEQSALGTAMQTGDSSSQAPWDFTPENGRDAEALDVYRTFARLHLRLFPYVWSYANQMVSDGRAIQRAFGLQWPALGLHPDDEYALGDALLVAPVVTAGATTRTLAVPPGRWLNWFDGTALEGGEGGTEVTVPAPFTTLPLFLRAGAMVPLLRPTIDTLSPAGDTTVESFARDAGILYVRIAPGPDSDFTVYDGTALRQRGGAVLEVEAGTVFVRGVVAEWMATARPTAVEVDGVAVSEVVAAALTEDVPGWAWSPEVGGTLSVRLPAGSRSATYR